MCILGVPKPIAVVFRVDDAYGSKTPMVGGPFRLPFLNHVGMDETFGKPILSQGALFQLSSSSALILLMIYLCMQWLATHVVYFVVGAPHPILGSRHLSVT